MASHPGESKSSLFEFNAVLEARIELEDDDVVGQGIGINACVNRCIVINANERNGAQRLLIISRFGGAVCQKSCQQEGTADGGNTM